MLDKMDKKILEGDLFVFKVQTEEKYKVYQIGEEVCCMYKSEKLDFSNDKDGFCKHIFLNEGVRKFLEKVPTAILSGAWLPEEKKFVVTDVEVILENEEIIFQNFEVYHHFLAFFKINYRMPIARFCDLKDTYFLERMLDTGTWKFKNYDNQMQQTWKIKST